MTKAQLQDYVNAELELLSFEDLLEVYDLTPVEVFTILFDNGHIDPELVEELAGAIE